MRQNARKASKQGQKIGYSMNSDPGAGKGNRRKFLDSKPRKQFHGSSSKVAVRDLGESDDFILNKTGFPYASRERSSGVNVKNSFGKAENANKRKAFSNKMKPGKALQRSSNSEKSAFSDDGDSDVESSEETTGLEKKNKVVKSTKSPKKGNHEKPLVGSDGKKILRFTDEGNSRIEDKELTSKKWFDAVPPDPEDFKMVADADSQHLKQEAKGFLENDTLSYRNVCSRGPAHSENQWLWTMLRKGTSEDRIAAGVVIIQNSPIHGLSILRSMVGLVKPGKKECVKAMVILSDLFLSDLLIPTRKLKSFEKRPLSIVNEITSRVLSKRKLYLMTWFFEDQLKEEYNNFIQNIFCVARECVENTKERAVGIMRKLLAGNPEQEALLLSNLVNKLGDPNQKVASKVIYNLLNLLYEHPNMKMVVTEEIEKFLFRPNVKSRAQYYAFCLLTQLLLSNEEAELAVKLIQIYFAFFKKCLKKGEVDSRVMSILLTGVNRAYPFAKKDMLKVAEHIEVLYKVVHVAHIGVSLHALYLLYQVADFDAGVTDRFYSALYRKLLVPELATSSYHALFLSLVYKSVNKDVQDSRIKAFIKRLLQLCHYVPVPLACGILITVSEILKNNKHLLSLTTSVTNFKTEDGDDSEEEEYADIELVEKEDGISFDSVVPDEKQKLDPTGEIEEAGEKDTTELVEEVMKEGKKKDYKVKNREVSSWYHCKILNKPRSSDHYDGYARNPLLAGREVLVYTELISLSTHFHPTVSLFASRLLNGEQLEYSGDPLHDFTLTKFLERFVFRNPKKMQNQPEEKPFSKLSRKYSYRPKGLRSMPVQSDQYLNAGEAKVPVEEQFMYRYLKGKQVKEEVLGDESDVSSVADDEFDQVVNQLISGKEVVNFADGIGKIPSAKEKRDRQRKGDSESEVDEDLSDGEDTDGSDRDLSEDGFEDDDDDAEDITFDGDEEKEKNFEFSMSDIENEDDDDDDESVNFLSGDNDNVKGVFMEKKKKRKGKSKRDINTSIFAPADEFAQLLEDAGDFHAKHRSLASLSNRDNAAVKQLKWEQSRDQRMRQRSNKRKQHGKQGSKPSKKFRRK